MALEAVESGSKYFNVYSNALKFWTALKSMHLKKFKVRYGMYITIFVYYGED